MRRTVRSRATALLLAALFLGGVGGASDVDALLFHGAGAPGAAATHYEPSGTTNHHADNCLLTFRVASGRGSASLGCPRPLRGHPPARRGSAARRRRRRASFPGFTRIPALHPQHSPKSAVVTLPVRVRATRARAHDHARPRPRTD